MCEDECDDEEFQCCCGLDNLNYINHYYLLSTKQKFPPLLPFRPHDLNPTKKRLFIIVSVRRWAPSSSLLLFLLAGIYIYNKNSSTPAGNTFNAVINCVYR